jgi:predicted RNase H-like HicB family nuclease
LVVLVGCQIFRGQLNPDILVESIVRWRKFDSDFRFRQGYVDGRSGESHPFLVRRKVHVTLLAHEEGVSVSCPELPGCHSQGANVEEALKNIEDAIRGYIDHYGEPKTRGEIREMEVITP